jgi:hypothetical protein
VSGAAPSGAAVSFVRSGFTWGYASAGVDLVVTRRLIVNLLQSDFLALNIPQLSGGTSRTADMRVSAGLSVRLGQR